jgi:hypothetical protein
MKTAHEIEEKYQNNNTIIATFNLYPMNSLNEKEAHK